MNPATCLSSNALIVPITKGSFNNQLAASETQDRSANPAQTTATFQTAFGSFSVAQITPGSFPLNNLQDSTTTIPNSTPFEALDPAVHFLNEFNPKKPYDFITRARIPADKCPTVSHEHLMALSDHIEYQNACKNLDMQESFQVLMQHISTEMPMEDSAEPELSDFLECAHAGNLETLKRMLDNGADMHQISKNGFSALHLAVEKNHFNIAQFLIERGICVNTQTARLHIIPEEPKGITALHIAVYNENIKMVRLLVKNGAHLETQDTDGFTALHDAAHLGSVAIIKYLLNAGADVHAQTHRHSTPLTLAIRSESIESSLLLIQRGADLKVQDIDGFTAVHYAAENGLGPVIEALIIRGVDINAQTNERTTPLHTLIENDHIQYVHLFLNNGADIHAKTITDTTVLHALTLAAKNGDPTYLECLDELIKRGIDVNAQEAYGLTALHIAIDRNLHQYTTKLLSHNALVNTSNIFGITALHIAAHIQATNIMEQLIARGADVNARNMKLQTALHLAAAGGSVLCIEMLLSNGADINALAASLHDNLHDCLRTPLYVAKNRGHTACVAILKKRGGVVSIIA